MINLGDKVKDSITGFGGVVVVRAEYLQGCDRCGLQSLKLKDGVPGEWVWFDEPQLQLVTRRFHPVGQQITGGPRPNPKRKR